MTPKPSASEHVNTLYYGDNLDVMRRYIDDESVDLIYLDPPFKSDQNYNVLEAISKPLLVAVRHIPSEDTLETAWWTFPTV